MIIDDYNIILGNNEENISKMIKYFKTFMKIKDKKYVGIDFEFNRVNNERQIALFQINLESPGTKTIFMFYPPDLTKKQLKVLKKLLFTENVIIHGGESLDIPYLFSEIFVKTVEIIDFLKNVKDTKFLCESYNYENNLIENKCKIYLLLLQMNVIDNDKLNVLLKNEEDMGPIYKIFIDVKNMSKELTYYSAYDVLYLPRLIETFPKNNYYDNILPELVNIVILAKHTNYIDDKLVLLNKFNNFFIMLNGNKMLFNDIYKITVEKIDFEHIDKILSSNYLKKFFQMIFKFVVYIYITNNYEYYISKDVKQNIKLNQIISYIDFFKYFEYGFEYLLDLSSHINLKIVKEILI